MNVLIAALVLSSTTVALLSTWIQENRVLAADRERLLATLIHDELREAFARKGLPWFQDQGFGPRFEDFGPLQATILADHPALTDPARPDLADSPTRRVLLEAMEVMQVQRVLLFEALPPSSAGRDQGLVRFVVRYRGRQGQPREVSSVRVVR